MYNFFDQLLYYSLMTLQNSFYEANINSSEKEGRGGGLNIIS